MASPLPKPDGAGERPEGDRIPEPEPDRTTYFPRGWRLALAVLLAMLIWLLVIIFWNPELWPWFRPGPA